jgi:formylglycine-generating enzyme required for sulfatase activity
VAKLGNECKVSLNVFDLAKAATESAATGAGPCTEAGIVRALDVAIAKLTGGVEWISIPGGTFEMGSGNSDEGLKHSVAVKGFQMAKTEVTVAQYKACVAAGACSDTGVASCGQYGNWDKGDRGNHPMNCIDWSQAGAVCKWVGGRLPSEAEWEYAARSGGKNREYPWGDQEATCERAVMKGNGNDGCGQDRTWPVCSKTSGNTAQGLCDMAGNVWEWVQDIYQSTYSGAPTNGSAWEGSGSARVDRGGSWLAGASDLRAAYRDRNDPSPRNNYLGVRCLRP